MGETVLRFSTKADPFRRYRVSVVIPTYRRDDLLGQAIQSALAQMQVDEYEIVILDNANSPGTLEATERICAGTNRAVSLYQNPSNLGMWGNMNLGLKVAKGEWVLILSDDDLLLPSAIEDFTGLGNQVTDKVWVLAGMTRMLYEYSGDRVPILRPKISSSVVAPIAHQFLSQDGIRQFVSDFDLVDTPKLCSTFFHRERILEIGGFDPGFFGYADLELILRVHRFQGLYICGKLFGEYRLYGGNASERNRFWDTYAVDAGHKLVNTYLRGDTVLQRTRTQKIQDSYFYHLIVAKMTATERSTVASDVLSRIGASNRAAGYLLRHRVLLHLLAKIRSLSRPVIRNLALLIGSSANTSTRE